MKLFQSKKGQQMPKSINLILAIITAAIGVLGMFGTAIGFSLPTIPAVIIYGIIVLAGIILLLDAMMGVGVSGVLPKKMNYPIGIIVLLGGAALMLNVLNIVPIPGIPEIAIHVLLMIGGALMLLDGILGTTY